MIDRNKRGIRSVSGRTRLAVAAAVLVAGGAAGVVAISAGHGGSTAAQSAGYTTGIHNTISEQVALTDALGSWSKSETASLTTLSKMTPMRAYSQMEYHNTVLDAQRGIVLLATKKFLVIRSANGSLHLWVLSGATQFKDISSTATGMTAMTGSWTAATAAMTTGNMAPSEEVVAGSTSMVSQLTTLAAKTSSMTISTGGQTVTINVSRSTATVWTKTTTTTTTITKTVQPTFQRNWGLERGDLVLIVGTRSHGQLKAGLVLFAAPLSTMPSAPSTVTPEPTVTVTVTPTAFPTSTAAGFPTGFPTATPTPRVTVTVTAGPNATYDGQPASIGGNS